MQPVFVRMLLGLGVSVALPAAASAQIVVGTVGHSLTDEYQRPQSSRQFGLEGFNWLEILSRTRASEIGFGAYDATLDGFSEPVGFAFNHAVGGAMVLNSNMQQQVADLAADVAAGEIDAVVVWIGENDFTVRRLRGESFDLNDPSFQAFQSALVTELVNALDTLISVGAMHIALARIGSDPSRPDIVSAASDTNAKIAAAVTSRPEVSVFAPLAELIARVDPATNQVHIGSFVAVGAAAPSSALVDPPGGVTPAQCGFNNQTQLPGCPTAAYQGYVIQDDGAHLTTPMQGLVANAVIAALRARGFALTPLSDAEILTVSGVPAGPPPSGTALQLSWQSLATRCKASSGRCRIKAKLFATNADTQATQPVTLRFLLSSDTSVDAGDFVVTSRSVPTLAPGARKKVKLKIKLPDGVTTTGRYLLVEPSAGAVFVQGPLS